MVVTRAERRGGRTAARWIAAGICAALFALIHWYYAASGTSQGTELDVSVAEWASSTVSDGATKFWEVFTLLGNSSAIIGMTIVLSLVIGAIAGIRRAVVLLGTVALTYAVNSALKAGIDRARPEAAWGIDTSGSSFPSANAMLTCTLFVLFAFLICDSPRIPRAVKLCIAMLAVILSLIMAWSRLYFSVHYATDVTAGLFAGAAIACAAAALTKART